MANEILGLDEKQAEGVRYMVQTIIGAFAGTLVQNGLSDAEVGDIFDGVKLAAAVTKQPTLPLIERALDNVLQGVPSIRAATDAIKNAPRGD